MVGRLAEVALGLIEPAGRCVAVDELAAGGSHSVRPATRAAHSDVCVDPLTGKYRGEQRKRQPVVSPKQSQAIDGKRPYVLPSELTERVIAGVERRIQRGLGKCVQHQ